MNKASQAAVVQLVMYGRSSCHLCDDMRDAITTLDGEFNFSLEFRDIDSNLEWHDKYALKIPVLVSGNTEICHYYLDPEALRAYFRAQAE